MSTIGRGCRLVGQRLGHGGSSRKGLLRASTVREDCPDGLRSNFSTPISWRAKELMVRNENSFGVLKVRSFVAGAKVGDPIPINVYKDGKDPVVMDDSEYPEWLWELEKPSETLASLDSNKESLTWEVGGKRYFKLQNRDKIKVANKTSGVV